MAADPKSERIPAQKKVKKGRKKSKRAKMTKKERRIAAGNPDGKTISYMNIDELRCAKNRALKAKNMEIALKYMQKMIPLCSDPCEHAELLLETADTLLALDSPKEAITMYQDFATMYPGHKRVTYALYKAIQCSYATVLIPERDQTATLATIEMGESFLKQAACSEYCAQVTTIVQACYHIHFESELSIIRFYIKQNNISSAQKRIERLRTIQLPLFPTGEESLITVECLLAQKSNDTKLLLEKQAELSTKFPKQRPTHLAKHKRSVDHVVKF